MTIKKLIEMLSAYPDDMAVKIISDENILDIQSVNSQKDEDEEFVLIW